MFAKQRVLPGCRANYICTQAPTEASVDDFWRMVWEQKSLLVVMLTREVEKDGVTLTALLVFHTPNSHPLLGCVSVYCVAYRILFNLQQKADRYWPEPFKPIAAAGSGAAAVVKPAAAASSPSKAGAAVTGAGANSGGAYYLPNESPVSKSTNKPSGLIHQPFSFPLLSVCAHELTSLLVCDGLMNRW